MSTRVQAAGLVTMQGHYAGAISRFVAYVIDVAVSSGLFAAGLAVVSYAAQVVTGQSIIDPWRGVLRALVFPLSFLFFGLGFAGILVQREHRALHDLIAGTAVVYSWDARSAGLRFLTREPASRARSPARAERS